MTKIRYLTVKEIMAINVAVIQKYSPKEQIGIKSQSLLESAVYGPQSSAFEQDAYLTLFSKAASLFESLGQNHPFHNANKRTAFTALVIFMDLNGFHFFMDQQKAIDFTVDIVEHKYTFEQLSAAIMKHSERKKH